MFLRLHLILFSILLTLPSYGIESYKMKLGDPLPANLFSELAKKINPTVVNISTSVRPRRGQRPNPQDPFWEFFDQFMGGQGMPRERRAHSIGTGFIIDEDGLIVTNSHVVNAADQIEVQLIGEDKFYKAELIGDDSTVDLALIKIKADKKLPVAKLGDSDKVRVGEWVAAFGNPYGHSFSMSKGIVSAKQRHISELSPVQFIQTDASINPGNSGGPLVNTKGEVIGINAAIDARAQGIGFTIPVNELKKIRKQLEKHGHVIRGYVGIGIDNITRRAQRALKLKDPHGALVMSIEKGGPAARGGIQTYDVIKKFDGKKITDSKDLINAVKSTPINKLAKVEVIRNGKTVNLKVKVGTPPGESLQAQKRQRPRPQKRGAIDPHNLGIRISGFTPKLAREFGLPKDAPKGPIVTVVEEGSPAWRSGLRPGDIILDVNQRKVRSPKGVFTLLRKGENILRVYNSGNLSLVFVEIE